VAALERLGDIVAGYQPDDAIRAAVKLRVADTLGAWIAATATAEGRALTGFRQPQASLPERIAISCALARLSEVDDIHLGAMITPGAIVIPAALTIAASMKEVGHDDLTAAVVAGYEAMIRLGTAIDGPSVLYRGIWPTYFAAPFGVAAVASRLLKLDAGRTAHALATALIMASPGTGHHAAVLTARWLAVGHAAARGFQAAQAAAAGFSSDVALLEGDLLKNIYGLSPDREVIAEPLDVPSLMRASFKPWCAARQTMAATQALKEILAEGRPGCNHLGRGSSAARAPADDRSRRHRRRPIFPPDQPAVPDGGGCVDAGGRPRPQPGPRRSDARCPGLDGAHQCPGR
jgi:2-methylcitrate dehydratase PrpD